MISLEQSLTENFGSLKNDEINKISSFFQPLTVPKGDFLFKTPRTCDRLCFIQSGYVRVFKNINNKDVTQWIGSRGYFMTDLASFIEEQPARFNIEALTDVDLLFITKKDYNNINQFVPLWPQLEKMFLIHCFTTLEDRIFSHLALSAEERYAQLLQYAPDLFLQVPLQYIASMLGMTPETLSRIRKKQMT